MEATPTTKKHDQTVIQASVFCSSATTMARKKTTENCAFSVVCSLNFGAFAGMKHLTSPDISSHLVYTYIFHIFF